MAKAPRSPFLFAGLAFFVLGSVSLCAVMGFMLNGIITDESRLISAWPVPMYLQRDGTVQTSAHIGGPFRLVDAKSGKVVTGSDYLGKWHLMYFGYTHCPDVCPTELEHIVEALDDMGNRGQSITPIFITVDPNRDNASTMAHYVGLFSPRLIGLTGDAQDIDQIVLEYNVYVLSNPGLVSGNDYDVVHSAFIYLMDPQGNLAAIYPPATQPSDLASDWTRVLESYGTSHGDGRSASALAHTHAMETG